MRQQVIPLIDVPVAGNPELFAAELSFKTCNGWVSAAKGWDCPILAAFFFTCTWSLSISFRRWPAR